MYWENIYLEAVSSSYSSQAADPEDDSTGIAWAFDGYPIGRSLTSMMLHCMAREIVHVVQALLNACSSRARKYAATQQHTLKFHNLIGTIFGHPDVTEKGS